VPVTLVTLGRILEAGETPLPGTFLARRHQDLDNPGGLGAFSIAGEDQEGTGNSGAPPGRDVGQISQRCKYMLCGSVQSPIIEIIL